MLSLFSLFQLRTYRPHLLQLGYELPQILGIDLPLAGCAPDDLDPARIKPYLLQDTFEHIDPLQGLVVAVPVVALSNAAAGDENPVRSPPQGFQDEAGVDPGRAHHPDVPGVGGILDA